VYSAAVDFIGLTPLRPKLLRSVLSAIAIKCAIGSECWHDVRIAEPAIVGGYRPAWADGGPARYLVTNVTKVGSHGTSCAQCVKRTRKKR